MSIGKTFNKFSKKYKGTMFPVGMGSGLTVLSLTVVGFFNPITGIAIGLYGVSAVAGAIAVNIKTEWKNAAGQTLEGSEGDKRFFEDCEKEMIKSLAEYDDATTESQRQKATANFHDTLNLLEQFFGDVKILSVDNVEEYCYGYEKIPENKTLSLEHLEANILKVSNKESEKPIAVSLRKKAGKFGV